MKNSIWDLNGKIFSQYNFILVVKVEVEGSYKGVKENYDNEWF